MTTAQMDEAKAMEFGGKVVGILNGASLAQILPRDGDRRSQRP